LGIINKLRKKRGLNIVKIFQNLCKKTTPLAGYSNNISHSSNDWVEQYISEFSGPKGSAIIYAGFGCHRIVSIDIALVDKKEQE